MCLLSAVCYGSMAVMVKLAYGLGLDEWQMLLCRFIFGSAFLGLWIALRDPSAFRIRPSRLAAIACVGVFIYTAQSLFFFRALRYVQASTTALIFYAYPALVTILSACFLRLRLSRSLVCSVVLVSGGCALVFADAFARRADPTGLLYAILATSVFSGYLLLCQLVMRDVRPLTATFYMILSTTLGFCLLKPPTALLGFSLPQMALGAALGLVPTAVAVSLLFAAIERVGSAYASVFSSFEPVATILFAALLLGEPLIAWQIAGTALILAGIALPNLVLRQQTKALRNSRTA
ncbi:DMT family transporter [Desulfovibrio sp. X2]|uniref:DMT family transporter n=1 Tax=Desulfovibrio sp. X2 TaxID=941449 RepID=UPI0003F8C997|nr:DMT family transporter [Desulfovibrio sp. X2]